MVVAKIKQLILSFKKAETLEKSRAKQFKRYAKHVNFAAGKEVLEFLVSAELEHLRYLKVQEKRLMEGLNIRPADVKPIIFKPKIGIWKRLFKKQLDVNEGDITILENSIELELADVEFYKQAIKETNCTEAKRFFRKMKDMEFTHVKLLRKVVKKARTEGIALTGYSYGTHFRKEVKKKRVKK